MLVVDDEKIVLDVMNRILSRLGYNTVITDSGEAALKRFSENLFDLVFVDVRMPQMSGFEVAKEMKVLRPDQKIVMMSGLMEDAAEVETCSRDLRVNDFMFKPFSIEEVKSILGRVFNA